MSPQLKAVVAVLCWATLATNLAFALTIQSSNPPLEFNTPKFELGVTDFDVTAPVALVDDICEGQPNVQNSFVLSDTSACSYETAIRACQSRGCVGVIVIIPYTVAGYRAHGMFDGSDRSDLVAPLVEITRGDAGLLLNYFASHPNMSVTVTNTDRNEWSDLFDSNGFLLLFQFLLLIPQVVAAMICWKTLQFYYGNLQRTQLYGYVPIVALMLEMAGNIQRAFYLAYDPFGSRQRLTFLWSTILITVSAPWAFISTILVIFYWDEVLRESHLVFDTRIKFLPTLKKPFVFVALCLVAEDLTFSILIGQFVLSQRVFRVVAAAYFIATVFLTLLICIYGYRVIQRYKRDCSETIERRRSTVEMVSVRLGTLHVVPEKKPSPNELKNQNDDEKSVSSLNQLSNAVDDRAGNRSSTYHLDLEAPASKQEAVVGTGANGIEEHAAKQGGISPAVRSTYKADHVSVQSRDLPEMSAVHDVEVNQEQKTEHSGHIVEVAASGITLKPVEDKPASPLSASIDASPIISEHSGMPVKPAGMPRRVAAEKNIEAHTKKKVYRMTVRILVSAAGMVILMAVCLLFLTQPRFVLTPFGYFGAWWLCEVSLIITSMAQIITFYH